jgi:hypothetical protein
MSGSIGVQGSVPSNLPDLKLGITEFVAAFEAGGGDGVYAGTRFNGNGATALTGSAYVSAAAFTAAVDGLTNPNDLTPTSAGINTGAAITAGGRPGVLNIIFVVTDGSPNKPNTHGDNLNNVDTWVQGANAAIASANSARSHGADVEAVYLSTAGDPGDVNLPFDAAGDAAWATAVMNQIGGGSHLNADFKSFTDDLFKSIGCPEPTPTPVEPTPTPVEPTPTPVDPTPTPVEPTPTPGEPTPTPGDPTPTPVTPTATPPGGGVDEATGTPSVTLPPTSTVDSDGTSGPDGGLPIALLGLIGLAGAIALITPAPAKARRRIDRD